MDFFNCTISREDRFQLRDWMGFLEYYSRIYRSYRCEDFSRVLATRYV